MNKKRLNFSLDFVNALHKLQKKHKLGTKDDMEQVIKEAWFTSSCLIAESECPHILVDMLEYFLTTEGYVKLPKKRNRK